MNAAPFQVAVVVVTYNSADVLAGCLASLPEGLRGVRLVEVVVGDNASTDGTAGLARRVHGVPVRVLEMGRNAGYAAAINAAVHALRGFELDAVLVLNPDARLRPGTVAKLAEALRAPGRGIAVPRLLNADGSLQPSLRRTPTVTRALAESVLGGATAGRLGGFGELITDPRVYEKAGSAAWATGAAMLISAGAIRDLGPWDESFLLYGEESEFALRAGDRGWKLWYEPEAVVDHDGGESGVNPMLWALLTVNRVRLYTRRRGRFAGAGYFLAVLLGEAVRALAGRATARAAVVALTRPSRRLRVLPG
ncbi:glycosyltransferase family 2 protein [Amycolatopsis nigrescens]|uniref:glycosyltransferase family 2 protein n=1 Tax=Amycolatopsis nigrescens TaxID=381445 RepID=UPI00036A6F61|nr:glycosyltransferase family 2 protein [Amycolatopsis nigrescens]